MGNEMFQARIPEDFAEEVHEYREDRHMSKSEVVRAGLRELVALEDEPDGDQGSDLLAAGHATSLPGLDVRQTFGVLVGSFLGSSFAIVVIP